MAAAVVEIISHLYFNLIQAKQLLALTFSRYVRVLRLSASPQLRLLIITCQFFNRVSLI